MTEHLLPCPFCSGKAELCHGYHAFYDAKVVCQECTAEGPLIDGNEQDGDINAAEAIAAWNRRAGQHVPGWVSVKDRMPGEGIQVLCTDGKYVGTGDYVAQGWGIDPPWEVDAEAVTHWQPFPAAPIAEKGERT